MTYRTLVIGKATYKYYVGKRFTRIRSPKTNKSHDIDHRVLFNIWDWDRLFYKGRMIEPVTPSILVAYIKKEGI